MATEDSSLENAPPQAVGESDTDGPQGVLVASRGAKVVAVIGAVVLAVALAAWSWRNVDQRPTTRVVTHSATLTSGKRRVTTRAETTVGTSEVSDATLVALVVAGSALLLGGFFGAQLARLKFLGMELELRNAVPIPVSGRVLAELLRHAPPNVRESPTRLVEAFETAIGEPQVRGSERRPSKEELQEAVRAALREVE